MDVRSFVGYYCPCGFIHKISIRHGQQMAEDFKTIGEHAWECMESNKAQTCYVLEQAAGTQVLVWALALTT